jgi:E3 ubiquitin-protein ligase HUWE1
MRLFAIVCSHYNIGDLSDENATMAYDFIRSLPIDQTPRPGWLTALFLFAETVMVLCNNTKDTKIGDPIERVTSIIRMEETERLLVACEGIFADTEATKDELLSAYRCMAIITRTDLKFDFSKCLTPFKHRIDPRLSRCHPGLAMILRHSFEDKPTLEYVMRREIRSHLYKDKTVDIRHFVKQLRHVTARDSDAFVDAMDKECILIDPAPVSQTYHIRPKELEKEAAPDPFQAGTVANPTMDALVLELGHATKATFDDVSASTGYPGLLFSLLTEVTGSYMSAKKSFMETLRLHGLHGQPKAKGGISTIITDLVGCLDLGKDFVQDGPKPQVTKRTVISGWSISLLVALCSDITPTSDIKSVSEDLVTIRRTVLDAIVKVLRDSSAQEPNVRYGKLWAVGELVYRLLNAKPAHSQRQHDESALQLAKLMVEKNLVGLMTEAAGSVDLNFPNIKAPLLSLLRALDHL